MAVPAAADDALCFRTDSPCGSPWTFDRLARADEFQTFAVGRRTAAYRRDVLAALERQRIKPRGGRRAQHSDDSDDALADALADGELVAGDAS